MKVYTDTPEGSTVIQNTFIDQYMPHANGEFVKIYLYLLRCANMDREISVSLVADVFEQTEKDVLRALSYWEKQDLIRMKVLEDGTIESLVFTDPDGYDVPVPETSSGRDMEEEAPSGAGRVFSDLEQEELSLLFAVAEQYLKRPLSVSEQEDIIYYYDTLHFSTDLIEYLYEYCIMRGKTSRHYIRKVALSWAEEGITTVAEAKKESNLYNKNYISIMKAFGLKGRSPAPAEQEMMSRWIDEYALPMDIILEACKRSIAQTHQPSFQYADAILQAWRGEGVQTMDDVNALDQKRAQEMSEKKSRPEYSKPKGGNRFNNFSQREYDYDELERQLLNRQ